MYQPFCKILLLAIALFLAGCSNTPSEAKARLQGRLLIWHPFQGKEAETLNLILNDYRELYPKVKIVSESVPEEEISEQFLQQAQSSLGPNLMISSYLSLRPLIKAGVLLPLNDYNLDLSTYFPRSILQVTVQDNLYGLPFSLNTQVLCYNKTKVEQPPKTLPEMRKEVQAKRQIALTSNFLDTFWGVQIFESKPSSEKEDFTGDFTFDSQAWAAWLEWLQQAKNHPDLILSSDQSTLHQTFATGKLAYYVCKSEEISDLKATLGEDKLGVTTLPGATNRPAGPLLFTRAVVFNQASSSATSQLALQLARFLTNAEQQTKLAIQTESLIPANSKVKLDERLSPIQAVLFAQSKTAVAVPLNFVYQFQKATEQDGELFYNLVLEGVMTPREGALELNQLFQDRRD
ncbi:MAG: extracellular solute-binding protein [Xenococcaceae cyanobacterium MO_234.B1]|nr:extracellular solute-binding protein [Xenococcaceae cyanobacterium MO_234.B1]